MKIYLVQHAQAKTEQEDPERPLSERGWSDINKVAAFISKNCDISVKEIFHSGKTRAQQTAEVLAKHLTPSILITESDCLNPLDAPSIWANRLAKRTEDTLLVGHLPHLSKLTSFLFCLFCLLRGKITDNKNNNNHSRFFFVKFPQWILSDILTQKSSALQLCTLLLVKETLGKGRTSVCISQGEISKLLNTPLRTVQWVIYKIQKLQYFKVDKIKKNICQNVYTINTLYPSQAYKNRTISLDNIILTGGYNAEDDFITHMNNKEKEPIVKRVTHNTWGIHSCIFDKKLYPQIGDVTDDKGNIYKNILETKIKNTDIRYFSMIINAKQNVDN